MAEVKPAPRTGVPPNVQERIDDYLTYVAAAWQGISVTAAEWPEWDEMSKLTFVCDWDVPNDRLHSLRQWAEMGLLSPDQRRRYDALLALVAEHQATLDWLLSDDS